MTPQIKSIPPKKLIGSRLNMSYANNWTFKLWNGFMPRRKEIANAVGTDMFSLQIYPEGFHAHFSPETEFEKWAAVEVTDFDAHPEGMETLELAGGQYAVFSYTGTPEEAVPFYSFIFNDWLPSSGYVLDNRPHFEVLGEKYKNGSPESEEEVWVPVKER
ncbi:GyrI-like domain-containing protein [Flavobacterium sp. MFBS3-15]|uniref:GyrI-like domain-containing protein n=1 Tax=Flavobacterium sp. MFBS3-15 TaxID=2989816 RepID=UPI002235723D|nr:GyrI-like domain-containing protein [Flavobacterium sp. MFBS3-15]MCW4469888.1 GyrI-like domain-containing protein [Flavobacterium sp. MFBS3-15]